MMAAAPYMPGSAMNRMPVVRGELVPNADLANMTWFRVGGPAEVLFRPADIDDLAAFLSACPADIPVTVIGVGSNLLVRDGGVDGVVIKLGRSFAYTTTDGLTLTAGAVTSDVNVALTACDAGIAGLEFLRGVPGTIGGAVRMNAGAYGAEIRDVLKSARAVDRSGKVHDVSASELGFSYRNCSAPKDWIFVEATFEGTAGEPEEIQSRMGKISAARSGSQPVKSRTGGSTFKNPTSASAWELVDQAGCRGLIVGDAQVSEQHCNFLINRGNATAADLETLGDTVRQRVLENSGVDLHWEIRRIGKARGDTE